MADPSIEVPVALAHRLRALLERQRCELRVELFRRYGIPEPKELDA